MTDKEERFVAYMAAGLVLIFAFSFAFGIYLILR